MAKSNIEIVQNYLKGERPLTIVGYQAPAEQKHEVGEKWTDAQGREWEQKENGPSRVTKVIDIVRAELDDRCATCGCEIRWGSKHDRKFYHKTGKCFDCLVKEETMLRIRGQYKLYEHQKVLQNQRSYLLDAKKKLREAYDYTREHKEFTFVNSNGFVETWNNDARDDLLKNVKKDFSNCVKALNAVEAELRKTNKQIDEVLNPSKVKM